ncbi:MAG: tRNA glutamyl-Q(34) synthetase GluQRS [Limisphaerales bacterium]
MSAYRGRIAPSPTGRLHLGHARTFWLAHQRASQASGEILLRIDDLDGPRCRPEFVAAAIEDLRWFGLDWDGEPITQSAREASYQDALLQLARIGQLYPCFCSRKDIQQAAAAPQEGDDETIYPGTCRPPDPTPIDVSTWDQFQSEFNQPRDGRVPCWRYRLPFEELIQFTDANFGAQTFQVGRSFGDFVAWRRDGLPSYQLACVVDDAELEITEVVRGKDLLASTARQLCIYHDLALNPPKWWHAELLRDENGQRLAKRHESLNLRTLREAGANPPDWIQEWCRFA